MPFVIPHPARPCIAKSPVRTTSPILSSRHYALSTNHYLQCFHILTNSLAPFKNLTPLFSSSSELFLQNTRGGLPTLYAPSSPVASVLPSNFTRSPHLFNNLRTLSVTTGAGAPYCFPFFTSLLPASLPQPTKLATAPSSRITAHRPRLPFFTRHSSLTTSGYEKTSLSSFDFQLSIFNSLVPPRITGHESPITLKPHLHPTMV
jgi:hypothetical protein